MRWRLTRFELTRWDGDRPVRRRVTTRLRSPFGTLDVSETVDSELVHTALDFGYLGLALLAAVVVVVLCRLRADSWWSHLALLITAAGLYLSIHSWLSLLSLWAIALGAVVANPPPRSDADLTPAGTPPVAAVVAREHRIPRHRHQFAPDRGANVAPGVGRLVAGHPHWTLPTHDVANGIGDGVRVGGVYKCRVRSRTFLERRGCRWPGPDNQGWPPRPAEGRSLRPTTSKQRVRNGCRAISGQNR